jgi:hypothetical protein
LRLTTRLAAAGLMAVGSLFLAGATAAFAAPPTVFTCSGTATSPGVVPAGSYLALRFPPSTFCQINGPDEVSVHSPLQLGPDAGLALFGGSLSVSGSLTLAHDAAFAAFTNSTPVDIQGPVTVLKNAFFLLGTETPGGPIFARIHGPVTGLGESSVQVHNTRVSGPVTLLEGGGVNAHAQMSSGGFPTNFNDLEDNQIHGPVTMSGYHGVWGGIIRNVIRGPMIFTHNKQAVIDEWDIGSNLINGFALCSDNVPPPNMGQSRGAPSIVRGPTLGDQAATCTGVPDGITGPPPAA